MKLGSKIEGNDDDNYQSANIESRDDGYEEDDADGFFNIRKPQSWWDCLRLLLNASE